MKPNVQFMKNLTILCITLILFSCTKDKEKPDYVLFDGSITNTDATVAVIRGYDFNLQMTVNDIGKFQDTLKIEKDGYYSLQVGRESSLIYLEKGGTLNVSLDASQFDESLTYTGTLAPENNYLAAKYMWNEINFDSKATFSKNEKDFLRDNDRMQKSYDSILESLEVKNQNFLTAEMNERNYIKASNIENYQNYYRYFTMNNTFKTSPAFYENLKGLNFADTIAFQNSASYQQLVSSHYQRLADEDLEKNDSLDISLAYLQKVNDNFPDGSTKQLLMKDRMTYGMTANNSLDDVYNL